METKIIEPTFWDSPANAKNILAQKSSLTKIITEFESCLHQAEHLTELVELYTPGEDDLFMKELHSIEEELTELELKKMLSGELDANGCYFSIQAGAGGTESCDWVAMLARMYTRWFVKKGWQFSQTAKIDGEVGIKSISYTVSGDFAYGYAKSEHGVHRLVRLSPFDSNNKRHTSFASVEVTPILPDDITVAITPDEIRVDTFRSSGPGGQHVNTTDSAVRITHLATNIVVSSQQERSQIQNREICMKMLQSRLYELEKAKRAADIEKLRGAKTANAWGAQIRSYVMHPYNMVKDSRSNISTGNVQMVLDGAIDIFVDGYLKQRGHDENS